MGLKGDLTELSLSDLVEMTSLGGKTGRIFIRDADESLLGDLAFRAGRLVGARCGELTAEKAFYALLIVKNGSFEFDPVDPSDEDTLNLGTELLLIEGMRRVDEIMRLRSHYPAPVRLLGGEGEDAVERRVLDSLGDGTCHVGDIVEGILAGGHADEYEVLHALQRLVQRKIVRVEPPQPELER